MLLRKAMAAAAAFVLALSIPILVLASQAKPTSITGAWSGTINWLKDGKVVDDDPIHLLLKHDGAVMTGSAGPVAERQYPMTKGKAVTTKDGTAITFEVTAGELVINFNLKFANGELTGSAEGQKGAEKRTATIIVEPVR
jgi:hypothetical protein